MLHLYPPSNELRQIQPLALPQIRPLDDIGEMPDLRWVCLDDLRVDPRYQRDIDGRGRKNISQIAAQFDWAFFGAILVCRNHDGLHIVDGQHRAIAARSIGIERVPAIITELNFEARAMAFVQTNSSAKKPTPIQVYNAALIARMDWAIAAKEIVERAGCELLRTNASTITLKPGKLFCVGLIKKFLAAGKSWAILYVLRAIRQSSQGDELDWYKAQPLNVLFKAFGDHPQLMQIDLKTILNKYDLLMIIDDAARRAKAQRKPKMEMQVNAVKTVCEIFAKQTGVELEGAIDSGRGKHE